LTLSFLLTTSPLESKLLNNLEVYNELTILVVSWHLYAFASSDDNNTTAGWSLIFLINLNIAVNLIAVVAELTS
jgi:hypothetical protein